MFDDLRARLADRRMTLDVTAEARRIIARQGFDPVYGARPLRRFISHQVETRIGRALLAGNVLDGATIHVTVADATTSTSPTTTRRRSTRKLPKHPARGPAPS